jgi:hypothetical protein
MSAQIQSARNQDENGFLLVKGCPISSFGIFDYSADQLGLPGDPNRIVKVYRPESAVNDQETLDSFKDLPFIDDHEMLSGFEGDQSAVAPEDYGIDGVLTSNVFYASPWMRGDIKIFSRKAQRALANKKKDLSLGYSCDFDINPGVFNGEPYEVVQTNMRGNHIALVDEGRVPGARVLDGRKVIYDHLSFATVRPSDNEESQMKKRALDANAVEALKAAGAQFNQAFQAFLAQESGEPEHQAGGAGGEGGGSSEGDMSQLNDDDPSAVADPDAAGGEGGDQLSQLLSQVEQLLASIRQTMSGSEGSEEGGDPTADGEEGGEGADQTQPSVDEGEEQENVEDAGKIADEEGNPEGLTGTGQAEAPEGPAAGKHPHAGDSAIRRFYADSAVKARIYDRASKVVGAFHHASMDSSQVYAYVLKKLQRDGKLKSIGAADAKIVRVAVDAYFDALEAAQKTHRASVHQNVRRTTGDSAVASDANMDAYLAGSK